MRIVWLLLLAVCFAPQSARAGGEVQAKLLADVSAVQAGKPFTLGVMFTIRPRWHIYWKNPGDAGLPTRVKFTLPEGFTAGELQFPTPVKIVDPGQIVAFGYQDKVLLTATVTPPAVLKSGDTLVFAVAAKWLCCNLQCVPGSAEVNLSLSVGDSATPDNVDLFNTWQQHMPTHDAKLKSSGALDAAKPHSSVTIRSQANGESDCIVGAVDGLTITAERVEGGNAYEIKSSRLQGIPVTAKTVEILITRPSPTGEGRAAVSVDVPIINGGTQ